MNEYLQKLSRIESELAKCNAHFDDVFCCPHSHKDHCLCKKPLSGMVDMAKNKFSIDVGHSYVIGDMGKSDMILANNVGAKSVLVLTGVGKASLNEFRYTWQDVQPTHISENLLEAAKWIVDDCT